MSSMIKSGSMMRMGADRETRQAATTIMAMFAVVVAMIMGVVFVAGEETVAALGAARLQHDGIVQKMTKLPVLATEQQLNSAATTTTTTTTTSAAAAVPACSYPNTSMVPFEYCPHLESVYLISQMELCLPFLLNETATPSTDCCGSISNISRAQPACFCKLTFYPLPLLNDSTQQKRLVGLCNVTMDLCTTCPQYLVTRTYNRPDWMDRPFWSTRGHRFPLVAKAAEYKTTAIWLAVLLALTYVGIAVTAAWVVHKRWKAKKMAAAQALGTKMSAFPTQPGSDF